MSPRRSLLLPVLLFLAPGPSFAGAGKDGFQVSVLGLSPRQAALAGTGAAESPDADAFSLNPGALGMVRAPEASLSFVSMPQSVTLQTAAYVHPLERNSFAGRICLLDAGGFQGYDDGGSPVGNVSAKESLLSLGWGRRLAGGGGVGASLSQARSAIGRDAASAFAAGVGWTQSLGNLPFRVSAALRNVGAKASYVKEKTALPQTAQAGLSYRGYNGALMAAVEANRTSEGVSSLAAGAEGWLRNTLALRAGWDGQRDLGRGLSVGLGFRLRELRIDYAFQPGGAAFGGAHRMGLSYRFGGAGDRAYQEGVALAQAGRYAEAIFKFKEALDADPANAQAVRSLREALAALERETGGDK